MATVKHQAVIKPGFAVGGYFDILGQSEALRRFQAGNLRPENPELPAMIQELLTPIQQFQWYFSESFSSSGVASEILGKLEKSSHSSLLEQSARSKTEAFFSDSCYLSQPLRLPYSSSEALSIYHFLLSSALGFLACCAERIPIRGGIQLGFEMEIAEGESQSPRFYGPLLGQCYRLESEIANFPRIVVGNDLLLYCEQQALAVANEKNATERIIFGMVFDLVSLGPDRVPELNLNSSALVTTLKENGHDHSELIENSLAFGEEQFRRHQEDRNQRISAKYALLIDYLGRSIAPSKVVE